MKIRFRIKSFELFFSAGFEVKQTGVNSKLEDGQHFLMWDFDDIDLDVVIANLKSIQGSFGLPDIIILNTGIPKHFHAYCFKRHSVQLTSYIIACTPNVDKQFYTIGILRGYWTLRLSDKKNRVFTRVCSLTSNRMPDVTWGEVKSFTEYYTKRK